MKKSFSVFVSIFITIALLYVTVNTQTLFGLKPERGFMFFYDLGMGIMSFPVCMAIDIQSFMFGPFCLALMLGYCYIAHSEWKSSPRTGIDALRFMFRVSSVFLVVSIVDYSFWVLGNAQLSHNPDWYQDMTHPDDLGHSNAIGWLTAIGHIVVFWLLQYWVTDEKTVRELIGKSEPEKEVAL